MRSIMTTSTALMFCHQEARNGEFIGCCRMYTLAYLLGSARMACLQHYRWQAFEQQLLNANLIEPSSYFRVPRWEDFGRSGLIGNIVAEVSGRYSIAAITGMICQVAVEQNLLYGWAWHYHIGALQNWGETVWILHLKIHHLANVVTSVD